MPTYAYACTACDHRFDAVQSFADSALTVCPSCEGRLRKVFASVGIVFKGSGFYRTDSRSGAGKDAGAPAGNGAKPGGSDLDKSPDKSAAPAGDRKAADSGSPKVSPSTSSGDKSSAPAAVAS